MLELSSDFAPEQRSWRARLKGIDDVRPFAAREFVSALLD